MELHNDCDRYCDFLFRRNVAPPRGIRFLPGKQAPWPPVPIAPRFLPLLQSVHDDPVGESRQVHVSVGDRRSREFRVIAPGVAGTILLIVPKLLAYVIRVERSQYPRAYGML